MSRTCRHLSLEIGLTRHAQSAAPVRPVRLMRVDGRQSRVLLAALVGILVVSGCARDLSALAPSLRPGQTTTPSTAAGPSAAVAATPKPSRAPKPYDLAIEAFVKSVTSKKLSYRIAFEGKTALSADTLAVAGGMDVSGADFASSWTYDLSRDYPGAGKIRVEVRAVKGKGYLRSDGGSWTSMKGFDITTDTYAPFKAVATAKDVSYLGPVTIEGTEYHKVSIPKAVLIHPTTIPGLIRQEKVDASTLELVIDDKGRPRRGVWHLKAQARVGESGQLQRIEYDLDLQFSKVGDKLTIKRP
jgi:hypothetical protein